MVINSNLRTPLLISAIFLTIALVLAGCGREVEEAPAEKETIRVGYLPITHSLPFLLAEQQGDFEHLNIEAVRFTSWPEVYESLQSGQIDAAISMTQAAMLGRQRGFPLRIAVLGHREGDAIIAREGIRSPEELDGTTVAIPHRLSGHNVLLYRALEMAGLSYEDITAVEMAPPDMMAALAVGEIDAYVVADPFGAIAVQEGVGHALLRAADIWPGWPCCALVVNEEELDVEGKALDELAQEIMVAGTRLSEDREWAVQVASEILEFDTEVMEISLEWMDYSNLRPRLEDYRLYQDLLLEMNLLPEAVNLEELFIEKYLDIEE